ncbi:MAG TPA: hypothetical protein VGT40_08115 [Methylomirabilota bacterium]|jgi:O-antigen/teichoic acid export membrane protein|nr:hypothetical protein [Methylomirabilota bacterium]
MPAGTADGGDLGTPPRDGIVSVVDQVAISAGNFATALILARVLDKSEFGLFVVASALMVLAVSLQEGFILQPLAVSGAGVDDAVFGRLLGAQMILQVVFLLAMSGGAFAVALVWEPLRPIAAPLAVASGLFQAQEFCRRALYCRGRVVAACLNDAISYDLQAIIIGFLAWSVGLSVGHALWMVALTSLIAVVAGLGQLRPFLTAAPDSLRSVLRQGLEIGKWTGSVRVVNALAYDAQPFILTALAGLPSAAGLGVVMRILGPLHLLDRPIYVYYVPAALRAFSREGPRGSRRIVAGAWWLMGPPYLVYVLGVILFAPLVLRVAFGEQYVQHADALRILAVSSGLGFGGALLWIVANVRRLHALWLVATVSSAVVIYTVGIYLISHHGLLGAALSTLASDVVGTVVFLLGLRLGTRRLASARAA